MGAIVLVAQDVERYLKFVVPFTDADDTSVEGMLSRLEAPKRQTFGALIGKFMKSASEINEDMENYLVGLIEQRNRIVHHFNDEYGLKIREGKASEVVLELKEHLKKLVVIRHLFKNFAARILELLRDTTLKNSSDLSELNELIASLDERAD